MAERHCRAQMRREIFRTLRINAKSMISQCEREFNEYAKTKRRRAHSGKDREVVKHAISQEVFEFIKGKDVLHEMFHLNSDDKENIPITGARTQDMPRPPQDFNMDSLLEDMDSLLEPILVQDFDMDSLLEPIDSLLEPIDTLIEDMDSLLEPIIVEDMDSLLEPIAYDSLIEDMDSLLEPIAFNISSNVENTEVIILLSSFIYLGFIFSCSRSRTISITLVPPSIFPSRVVCTELHSISITFGVSLCVIVVVALAGLFIFSLDLNTTPIIGFDMRGFMFSSSSIYGLCNGFSILKHSSRES